MQLNLLFILCATKSGLIVIIITIIIIIIINPQKTLPYAETRRLSHKAWKSVQRYDLGAFSKKGQDSQKSYKVVIFKCLVVGDRTPMSYRGGMIKWRKAHLMPKFHYIYLAQNLLKTRFSTRFPTCFEQVLDMSQTSQRPKKVETCRDRSSRSATCLRLFLSKSGFEQDRSSGI